MRDLTKDTLLELGFKIEFVTPEESGTPNGYHYFFYELGNGECLISNSDDETTDGFFEIKFLTIDELGSYYTKDQVFKLIKSLRREL